MKARRPRGKPRERRDSAATRQALLQAGARLFAERGFDGVTTEDVARRAGVNKALISYHFGGKRALYVAVLEAGFATMSDRLEAIERESRSARGALHGVIGAFETISRERPDFPVLFVREIVSRGIEPAVMERLVRIVGVSRRIVTRGRDEGVFGPVDPVLFHFGLVGALAFFLATLPARRRAEARFRLPFAMPTTEAFLAYVEALTLRGLAPERPSDPQKGARA